MNKSIKIIILFICLFTTLLSACSYKEFEDSLRGKEIKEDDESINLSSIPDNSKSDEEKLSFTGDTITYKDSNEETVQYTLDGVHILDNINDLDLNIEDFDDKSLVFDDGAVDETYKFVIIDITVKNIDFNGYDSENDDPILYIDPAVGFKDEIEDPDGPFFLYASYFSDHPPFNQNQGQDYYQFSLAKGKEMKTKIGWFLPADQLEEESLYYIIGGETSPEDHQYFELKVD